MDKEQRFSTSKKVEPIIKRAKSRTEDQEKPLLEQQSRWASGARVTLVGFLFNIALMVFKGFAGIVGRSQAVLADAVESLSDIVATVVVWFGLGAARKPSDFEHPYGHHKFETVAAVIVGVIILLGSFGIASYSLNSIITGRIAIPSAIALIAAIATIIVKEGLYQYTIRIGRRINSMAVTANAWDHRKDALTTVATLIGVAGARAGFPVLDPIAAIVVAIIILRIGFSVSWGALNELIDIAPSPEILIKIRETAESVPGIEHVRRFRARKTGPYMYVDVEVEIDESLTVHESHQRAEEVKDKLRQVLPDIRDVMIHVEPHKEHH